MPLKWIHPLCSRMSYATVRFGFSLISLLGRKRAYLHLNTGNGRNRGVSTANFIPNCTCVLFSMERRIMHRPVTDLNRESLISSLLWRKRLNTISKWAPESIELYRRQGSRGYWDGTWEERRYGSGSALFYFIVRAWQTFYLFAHFLCCPSRNVPPFR